MYSMRLDLNGPAAAGVNRFGLLTRSRPKGVGAAILALAGRVGMALAVDTVPSRRRVAAARPFWLAAMACLIVACPAALRAGNIYVPNYSFELPNIGTNSPYAAPVLESWQETPQPFWYDPADFGGSPWSYLVGTFYNLPNYTNATGSSDTYIYNCVGTQAAFLFGVPQVGIWQQLSATYNVGKCYTMTVGVIGGGGGMPDGSTLDLIFFYVDAQGNTNVIADATVTNTTPNFPNDTNLVDFRVELPGVQATDPWAGQNIGIEILATPDFFNPASWGGYWDLDNVRLVEGIYVPNHSFELPNIGTNSPYAAPILDAWEESPQPPWYDPADFGGSPWSFLVGTFYNLPNYTNATGSSDTYIYNCDGVQAAFLFGIPQVAIFQDYNSIGEDTNVATHAFNATYHVGKSYTMTVGLIGGGGGMPIGSTFELDLYYVDASANMNIIASTTVTNTLENFPTDTEFVDFQVLLPPVKFTDPWAGQHIGIQLQATPDFFDPTTWGGYWDANNVRLVETTPLSLGRPGGTNGQFGVTVLSEPNTAARVLASSDLTLPLASWTSLGTITNLTGATTFVDASGGGARRYYTAEVVSP